jgi:serine protease Do
MALLLAALLAAVPAARAQTPLAPPPPNPGDAPKAPATPRIVAPRRITCPRCGYLCDPGWHFCIACGWDLTSLVGASEEAHLQSIARSAVRVTVGGRRNRYASAFPYGTEGLLLTNARVLIDADESRLKVMTYNNREYPASVVGYDLPSGVGLLQADIPGIGDIETAPASLSPPEFTWAVCYPVEFEDDVVELLPVSLHRGHVTATGQTGTSFVSFENLLRTDHAIENGCTGGPLMDSRGRIAGMILGSPDDGITYAQPLEGMAAIVDTLRKHQHPTRPYFGVGLVMPDDRRRAKFPLGPDLASPVIGYLIPGGPASAAGVHAGDALLAVGTQKTGNVREAGAQLLATVAGGAAVTLTLLRSGSEIKIPVAPTIRPARVMLEPADEIQETLEVNLNEVTTGPGPQQGLVLADLVRGGRGEKEHYGNGDIIVSVDGKSVKTLQALNSAVRMKFKEIFADHPPADKQFASSYFFPMEIRKVERDKETRNYVNLFPDFLAAPVY